MKSMLVIDACVRGNNSRTLALARELIDVLESYYNIEWVRLNDLNLQLIDSERYIDRSNGNYDGAELLAMQFAKVDLIMVIAPFWDMSFPAMLKAYFEHISISGITFCDTPQGTIGNCRADKMLYVTTRGMEIPTNDYRDQGTTYLKALGWLWGIPKVYTVAAWGMDVVSAEERNERLKKAVEEGKIIVEELLNDKIS